MSIRVMVRVWEESDASGADLLMLLALADAANDEGVTWPTVATLAKKARVSVRAAQATIKRLSTAGQDGRPPHIEVIRRRRENNSLTSNAYRLSRYVDGGGAVDDTGGVVQWTTPGVVQPTTPPITVSSNHQVPAEPGRPVEQPASVTEKKVPLEELRAMVGALLILTGEKDFRFPVHVKAARSLWLAGYRAEDVERTFRYIRARADYLSGQPVTMATIAKYVHLACKPEPAPVGAWEGIDA